jgi:hypothetical protein
MSAHGLLGHGGSVPQFVIHHRHEAAECGIVFASFRGVASPVRHRPTIASCPCGGPAVSHEIWWSVEADGERAALEQLPFYVAERATAVRVERVEIP